MARDEHVLVDPILRIATKLDNRFGGFFSYICRRSHLLVFSSVGRRAVSQFSRSILFIMYARGPSFRSHAVCALLLTFLSLFTFSHASTVKAKRLDHVVDSMSDWKAPVWKNRFPMKRDSYTFNATSHKNLAVYFGQTAATKTTTLYNQCADDSVDIVMLAFLRKIYAAGGYPYLDMGSTCSGTSDAQEEAGATELLDCSNSLGVMITQCQALGKKVLLSIGGSGDDIAFSSADNATESATLLWNLFGGGSNYTSLRPFGNATIDGFDLGKYIL